MTKTEIETWLDRLTPDQVREEQARAAGAVEEFTRELAEAREGLAYWALRLECVNSRLAPGA